METRAEYEWCKRMIGYEKKNALSSLSWMFGMRMLYLLQSAFNDEVRLLILIKSKRRLFRLVL